MNARPDLCIVTASTADGGVEVCDRRIAQHHARLGRRVCIVITQGDFMTGRLGPEEARIDIRHDLKFCDRWWRWRNLLLGLRFFRRLKPGAVLFDHTTLPAFTTLMVSARLAGVERIVSCLYFSPTEPRPDNAPRKLRGLLPALPWWWLRRREKLRWSFAANDRVLFGTREHLDRFCRDLELPLRQGGVVPHLGADTERFRPDPARRAAIRATWQLPENELCVGYVGRLSQEKGVDLLLDALASLQRKGLSPTCVLAGDGPLRANLHEQADRLGLKEKVRFLGRIDDVPAAQDGFDITAMPSREECFGLALVEAMASGNAVVATTVGGMTEILTHDRDGLQIPPEDPAALGGAIARLLKDPDLRRRLGQAARQTVLHHYSQQSVLARLDEAMGFEPRRKSPPTAMPLRQKGLS